MIDKVILDYLTTKLAPIPVYLEEPKEKTETYVLASYRLSGKLNHLKEGYVTLKSYAPSMYMAAVLNDTVQEAMDSIIEEDEITSSQLNTSNPNEDTQTVRYRYISVYYIHHY